MKLALFFFATFSLSFFSFWSEKQLPCFGSEADSKGMSVLVKNNQTVPLSELNKQLKQAIGKKAKISRVASFVYDPRSLYRLCKPSTLIVARLYKCGRCTNWHSGSATGFPLTKDGIFATNYHVLEQTDGKTLAVMDTEENVYPVTQFWLRIKTVMWRLCGQRVQNSGHFLG